MNEKEYMCLLVPDKSYSADCTPMDAAMVFTETTEDAAKLFLENIENVNLQDALILVLEEVNTVPTVYEIEIGYTVKLSNCNRSAFD